MTWAISAPRVVPEKAGMAIGSGLTAPVDVDLDLRGGRRDDQGAAEQGGGHQQQSFQAHRVSFSAIPSSTEQACFALKFRAIF
jgi:hypothetical protein